MNDISITVLMTVYNGGEYLRQAIDSVLGQSYADFEFLIINDCSTDDTEKVIRSYNDNRITLHNNEVNSGQTHSLNLGFNMAKGKYVLRIDADDVAFPNWVESQVAFIKKEPGYDVVSAGLVTIDPNNKIMKNYPMTLSRDDMMLKAIVNSPVNHGSSIMKKDTVLAVGGYDEKYRIAADYCLWIKLMGENAKITGNSEFLMAIRRHDASVCEQGRSGSIILELSDIIRRHINRISDAGLSEEDSVLLCRAHYDEGSISFQEFQKALAVHSRIYELLKISMGLDKNAVVKWRHLQRRTFYLRRAYFFISKGDFYEVRDVSREGIKDFGIFNLFAVLFFLTFFGNIFLKNIPWLYNKIYEIRSLITIKERFDIAQKDESGNAA